MAYHRRVAWRAVAVGLLVALGAACSDDATPAPTTTTGRPGDTTTSTLATDPTLRPLLLTAADLPAGFAPAAEDIGDTVTSFCAGQDAAAGLQASGRELAGFTRTPAGASVIHLVFRFEGTGATDFVTQAETLFTGCSEVPDITGLAFAYAPVDPALDALLAEGTDRHAARYGVSVGSGNLTVDVAVFQRGDLGVLVAVLGLEQARADLDALADAALRGALAKLGP